MTINSVQSCSNLGKTSFESDKASEDVWGALVSAGVLLEGEFDFASGVRATLKAEIEQLYKHPREYDIVLGHFATFPCIKDADVLLYVPYGIQPFVTRLGEELGVPVAHTDRVPGSQSRYDFMFKTLADKEMALSAVKPRIGEDIVTTLGSVAGVRRLLRSQQDVHSLAVLLRGTVNPDYRIGLVDHYLTQRDIPLDKDEFNARLSAGYYSRQP